MSSKTIVQIRGLRNATYSAHHEKRIEAVPGVQSVEIDPTNEQAVVEHDGADLHKIQVAIAEEGFE